MYLPCQGQAVTMSHAHLAALHLDVPAGSEGGAHLTTSMRMRLHLVPTISEMVNDELDESQVLACAQRLPGDSNQDFQQWVEYMEGRRQHQTANSLQIEVQDRSTCKPAKLSMIFDAVH